MRNKKGFTLVELIIVLVIIGVLTAVLIPAWVNYIRKGRLKTQNNQARTVYTSAQTLIQDYRFIERKQNEADRDIGSHAFELYWNGATATATVGYTVDEINNAPAGGSPSGTLCTPDNAVVQRLGRKLNDLSGADGDIVYKLYVENYIVKAVVSGRYDTDRFLGMYPNKNDSVIDQDVVSNHVSKYDMTSLF